MDDWPYFEDPEEDDDEDTGDDRNRLRGRHTERECRYHRDETARREAFYQSLGAGREYRHLVSATNRELPRRDPKALPLRRQLAAPQQPPTDPDSGKEE